MDISSAQGNEQWVGTLKVSSMQNADMSTKDIVIIELGRLD